MIEQLMLMAAGYYKMIINIAPFIPIVIIFQLLVLKVEEEKERKALAQIEWLIQTEIEWLLNEYDIQEARILSKVITENVIDSEVYAKVIRERIAENKVSVIVDKELEKYYQRG